MSRPERASSLRYKPKGGTGASSEATVSQSFGAMPSYPVFDEHATAAPSAHPAAPTASSHVAVPPGRLGVVSANVSRTWKRGAPTSDPANSIRRVPSSGTTDSALAPWANEPADSSVAMPGAAVKDALTVSTPCHQPAQASRIATPMSEPSLTPMLELQSASRLREICAPKSMGSLEEEDEVMSESEPWVSAPQAAVSPQLHLPKKGTRFANKRNEEESSSKRSKLAGPVSVSCDDAAMFRDGFSSTYNRISEGFRDAAGGQAQDEYPSPAEHPFETFGESSAQPVTRSVAIVAPPSVRRHRAVSSFSSSMGASPVCASATHDGSASASHLTRDVLASAEPLVLSQSQPESRATNATPQDLKLFINTEATAHAEFPLMHSAGSTTALTLESNRPFTAASDASSCAAPPLVRASSWSGVPHLCSGLIPSPAAPSVDGDDFDMVSVRNPKRSRPGARADRNQAVPTIPGCPVEAPTQPYQFVFRTFAAEGVPRMISSKQLADLLQGRTRRLRELRGRLVIIDCRFEQEYAAGHIQGAFSLLHPKDVLHFFETPGLFHERIFVFHCEFSQRRGPLAFQLFRSEDRRRNLPTGRLCFPQAFVLHQGYKAFHHEYGWLCEGGYLPMKTIENADDLVHQYESRQTQLMKQSSSSSSSGRHLPARPPRLRSNMAAASELRPGGGLPPHSLLVRGRAASRAQSEADSAVSLPSTVASLDAAPHPEIQRQDSPDSCCEEEKETQAPACLGSTRSAFGTPVKFQTIRDVNTTATLEELHPILQQYWHPYRGTLVIQTEYERAVCASGSVVSSPAKSHISTTSLCPKNHRSSSSTQSRSLLEGDKVARNLFGDDTEDHEMDHIAHRSSSSFGLTGTVSLDLIEGRGASAPPEPSCGLALPAPSVEGGADAEELAGGESPAALDIPEHVGVVRSHRDRSSTWVPSHRRPASSASDSAHLPPPKPVSQLAPVARRRGRARACTAPERVDDEQDLTNSYDPGYPPLSDSESDVLAQ
jgi:rhodanese-related sulfurtransferase